jgi:hypothetical protein
VRTLFKRLAAVSAGKRWAVWIGALVVWTLCLVTPYPVQVGHEVLPAPATYPTAKGLHVSVYALLTVLAAWLPVARPRRWLLLAVLSLHGFATEYVQTYVPARTGCWQDVGMDHVGLLLGFLLGLRWWLAREGCTVQSVRAVPRPEAA